MSDTSKQWQAQALLDFDAALSAAIPLNSIDGLGPVMAYAALQGGKRLRPLLVLAACDAVQGNRQAALLAAVAVELIHAYSLVHDDLPCMDNDVLRRGQPTTHVRYGEAMAMLAGDAMQALAFEVITPPSGLSMTLQARWVASLARAAGHAGMAGGQAIDLAHVGLSMDLKLLELMHALKTGSLIQVCITMGALTGAAGSSETDVHPWHSLAGFAHLQEFGRCLGLVFQVVDDILDVTQDSVTLGKTAGKDQAQNKPTFVSLMGLDAARAYAQAVHAQALQALQASGLSASATQALRLLAEQVLHRCH